MTKRWTDASEAALNAVLGDHLEAQDSRLAIDMGFFDRGQRLATWPRRARKLVVMVHGMACTEDCWAFPDTPEDDYGRRLQREYGLTPLYLRYNTGRPIWKNGQEFAQLLDDLVTCSEEPVEELTLIGHSLGGLVIRSACHEGREQVWLHRVKRAFYLGSPHQGSPWERWGRRVTRIMHRIPDPVVQLIGDVADARSAAVKSLGEGDLTEDGQRIPLYEACGHYFVAGSLSAEAVAAWVGDGLVPLASATGLAGSDDHVGHFTGLDHMALAHHPDVYAWIAQRVGPAEPTEPARPEVSGGPRSPRLAATVALGAEGVEKAARAVQKVNETLAARPYAILDKIPVLRRPSRAVRNVHFGLMRGGYGAVRLGSTLVGAAADALSPQKAAPEEGSAEDASPDKPAALEE